MADAFASLIDVSKDNNLTFQTLFLMSQIVKRDVMLENASKITVCEHLELKKVVADLLKNVAGHDFTGEIKVLFEFVRDKIRYQRDNLNLEVISDAYRTLFYFGSGDCDDKSTLLATLLGIAGHDARFKVIGYGYYLDKFHHVYVQVYDKNQRKWISLDPTNERANVGWEAETYNHSSVFKIYRKW